MKIKNTTKWDSADLRKMFRRIVREAEHRENHKGTFKRKSSYFELQIENYCWGDTVGGRATLFGCWIYLKIGEKAIMNEKTKTRLAKVMMHEYYHSMGFKHKHMGVRGGDYSKDVTESFDYSWVKDFEIKEAVDKPKKEVDTIRLRYERAIQNLRKAETRKKRATTIHKKWVSKVKYYEKTYNYKPKKQHENL